MRSVFVVTLLLLVGLAPTAQAGVCLDGHSGCVLFQQALPAYHSFTVELRFMWESPPPPPPVGDQAAIFYEGSGGELQVWYQHDEGVPMLRFDANFHIPGHSWAGTPPFSLLPWVDGLPHHLAAVYDSGAGEARVYIDGILIEAASAPTAQLQNPGWGTALGRFGDGTYKYAYGAFEELRFWTRALTQEEITENMWTPLSGNEPGLVGYWPLDEGSGAITYDRSPSGNHGNLLGGIEWCFLSSGACCLPDGSCEILPEQHCPGDFMGHGTFCDPNPCEPPIPTIDSSWGQIKNRHR